MTQDMATWEAWRSLHQPFELRHWVESNILAPAGGGIPWAADPSWRRHWNEVFKLYGPKGRRLDIGCGPRPPLGKGSTAIDPLIDQYKEHVPPEWWEGIEAYSVPAEERQKLAKFDSVMCWNCLDHTIGWRDIMANMASYAKPNARIVIATNFDPPTLGHPGYKREDFMSELIRHFQIVKWREDFQGSALALVLKRS